jgi:hypothetical protein
MGVDRDLTVFLAENAQRFSRLNGANKRRRV